MIKNIIFDLDNTIIEDKEDYIVTYKKSLINSGYDEKDFYKIYDIIEEYDSTLTEQKNFYSKNSLIEFINKKLNRNFDIKLIDEINNTIQKEWIKYILIPEETLIYLNNKYNLYVFTNWFEECQAERLKNIGYLKYFKKVFGSDNFGAKPFKNSFNNVLKYLNCLPNQCIMIGDSIKNDISGANLAGIYGILFDYDGKRNKKCNTCTNYKVITNATELEKIL